MPWRSLTEEELDLGIYSPAMAGALAGVSGRSIGQWARVGLIRASVFRGRPSHLYSYFDVAEAIVVRWLLNEGLRHKDIRLALSGVREEHPDWPLLRAPLGVGRLSLDDRALIVRRVADGTYLDAVDRTKPGQIIIKPVFLGQARDMLAHGGWVAAARHLERIEVRPLKLGGAPSLSGRRWTVEMTARMAEDEGGREVLMGTYGLAAEEVDEAVSWMDGARDLARA